MSQHFSAILDNLRMVAAIRKSSKEAAMQQDSILSIPSASVKPSICDQDQVALQQISNNTNKPAKEKLPSFESLNSTTDNRQTNHTHITIEIDRTRSPVGNSSVQKVADQNSASNLSELTPPSTKSPQQRRMSISSYRSRTGSFIPVDEEGRSILLRKPIRLKNIEGRAEVYDTLHLKGGEVNQDNIINIFSRFLIIIIKLRKLKEKCNKYKLKSFNCLV